MSSSADVEGNIHSEMNRPLSKYEQSRIRQCEVPGCDRPYRAKGCCAGHYNRLVRYGDTFPDRPLDARKNAFGSQTCDIPGCYNYLWAAGYCRPHYRRLQDTGDVRPDQPLAGTGRITDDGYREVFVGEGYPGANDRGQMLEHRFVMSRFLERPLLSEETVHHKYGDKTDNRIENLELWSSSHPAGQRIEDKVEWAKSILTLYDPDALKENDG